MSIRYKIDYKLLEVPEINDLFFNGMEICSMKTDDTVIIAIVVVVLVFSIVFVFVGVKFFRRKFPNCKLIFQRNTTLTGKPRF